MPGPDLDSLRRYAVSRSLFPPTSLPRAIARLGFVQADPIRAPARAQDLTLRHRVRDYHAGDLERRYPRLAIEEDVFVNYGFVSRPIALLMHPRIPPKRWPAKRARDAERVLEFIRTRGATHPREVDDAFSFGRTTNWFGGKSRVGTQLLEAMHYRGLVRVVRRDAGIRVYGARELLVPVETPAERRRRVDLLVDVIVDKYAPLPARSLSGLIRRLRYGAPQLQAELTGAIGRARARFPTARIDGVDWYWPDGERPGSSRHDPPEVVRFLAPFDPVVWDRWRFLLLWNWEYRFEAYTKAPLRKLAYYALPLLWRDRVIGWASVSAATGTPAVTVGYVSGAAPPEPAFHRELEREIDRMARFLAPRSASS